MKRFIKGRWFPLAVAGVCVLAFVLILFCLGFRITYAPKLENSWEAVSAVAAWGSIIIAMVSAAASFAAVWYAIKISDKQNRVALFEKRHEIFDLYNSCKVFSDLLKLAKNSTDVQVMFLAIFSDIPMGEKVDDSFFIRKEYIVVLEKLKRSQFLFDVSIVPYVREIVNALMDVVNESLQRSDSSRLNEKIQSYIEIMNSKEYQIVLNKMGKDLVLK